MEMLRVKNKFKNMLNIFSIVFLSSPAISLAISENDFAYKAVLGTDASTPFYELEIPEIVYRNVSRDDLGDIRVLNGAGSVVPHGIRNLAAEKTSKINLKPVPYFPLFEIEGSVPGSLHLNIQRSSSGEVIDIQSGGTEHNANQRLVGYLLDLREWKQAIETLKFSWKAGEDISFIRKLELSVSDDLSNWKSVSQDNTLVNLSYQKNILIEDTLKLSIASAKYLRVIYADNKPGLEINNITVSNTQSSLKNEINWKRSVVSQHGDSEKTKAGEYYFNHELKTTLNKLRVKLPENNTVVKVNVFSRANKDNIWRHRGSAVLYRLSVDGINIQHTDISVNSSRDTQWKLQIDQQGGGIGSGLPEIYLAWQPQQLVFVARGQAPYTLVWGSARVPPVTQDASKILVGVNQKSITSMLANAIWLDNTVSNVNLRSLETANKPVNWRQWFLWAVLVIAALLLIWMAVRLMGKMAE